MTLRATIVRTLSSLILITLSGCVSTPRTVTTPYPDHLGNLVQPASELSIRTKDGAIEFSLSRGWLVWQQPGQYEWGLYAFSHSSSGLDAPLLTIGVVGDPASRATSSPQELIERRLTEQLKGSPHAGWQRIADATTASGRVVPIYIAVGFPAGGWLVTGIPEDGFFTWILLDTAQGSFDRMMSFRSSLTELITSYSPLPKSSNQTIEPTASRRTI